MVEANREKKKRELEEPEREKEEESLGDKKGMMTVEEMRRKMRGR